MDGQSRQGSKRHQRLYGFLAVKHGSTLHNLTLNVKVKHLYPINNWEPGFLKRQIAHPWQNAGTVQLTGYQFFSKS